MWIKNLWLIFLTSYILSPKSIPPPIDKTWFWAGCRTKWEMLCPLFFTQVSLSGFFELFLLKYFTVLLRDSETICVQFNAKPKRRSYRYCTSRWIPTVYIIPTLLWPWHICSSLKSRYALVTQTRNLALTHFFLLLWIT